MEGYIEIIDQRIMSLLVLNCAFLTIVGFLGIYIAGRCLATKIEKNIIVLPWALFTIFLIVGSMYLIAIPSLAICWKIGLIPYKEFSPLSIVHLCLSGGIMLLVFHRGTKKPLIR